MVKKIEYDTDDFSAYEESMGKTQVQNNIFGYSEEELVKGHVEPPEDKKEKKRDDKGRFKKDDDPAAEAKDERGEEPKGEAASADAGKAAKGEDEKKDLDGMGKFKRRLEREKKKREAIQKENEELKKKLESQNKSDPPPSDPPADPPKNDKKELVEPKKEDFEDEDQYWDAMIDYWDAVDEEDQPNKEAEPAEDKETKAGDEPEEGDEEPKKEVQEKETPLNQQEDAGATLWDDLSEILDEVEGEGISENLVDDLAKGLNERKIFMSDEMAEWLVDNEDKAGAVVQEFIDKPRQSRKIARAVGIKQEQMLTELANSIESRGEAEEQPTDYPTLSGMKGKGRAPAQDFSDSTNFADYENQEKEKETRSSWGWGA